MRLVTILVDGHNFKVAVLFEQFFEDEIDHICVLLLRVVRVLSLGEDGVPLVVSDYAVFFLVIFNNGDVSLRVIRLVEVD